MVVLMMSVVVVTVITMSVQAFLFYLPRMIWLSMEGGLMAFLCEGCQGQLCYGILFVIIYLFLIFLFLKEISYFLVHKSLPRPRCGEKP